MINIIGWYGKGNAGDEAFRHVFEKIIFPNEELNFTTGGEWKAGHRTIIGGGDVIHKFYTQHLPQGTEVELLSVGLGNYATAREALKHLVVKSAVVRSKKDADFFKCQYAPDMVLQYMSRVEVERTDKIGICLSGWKNQHEIAQKIINKVGRKNIVWISLSDDANHNDVAMNNIFAKHYGGEHWHGGDTEQYLKYFGRIKKLYTTRLHSMIFCDIQKTPFVQLSNEKKFFDYLNDQNRLELLNPAPFRDK
jgi:polysaccharide pyruvyl transferase WcaK-like protein